ncbi:MAG: hypothetical protein COB93_11590 [Sneathiella sp.]|nr:MAG: hypothetical protein COB93_11590 [Sneathiella sp.]
MAKLGALVRAGVANTEGFYTLGGRLAIDFANSHRRIGHDRDGLGSFEDLLSFLKSHGHLHEDEASDLHMFLFQNPERCHSVVEALVGLRTKFHNVLTNSAGGWPIDLDFLNEINQRLEAFKSHLKVESTDEGMALKTVISEQGPEKLAYPILKDIADFLASDHVEKTKSCAGDDCGLYFVNLSRNGRRRWCSMSTCGNRAKVNAYLKRQEA